MIGIFDLTRDFSMLDAFHDAALPIYSVVQPGVLCGQEGVGIDQPTL